MKAKNSSPVTQTISRREWKRKAVHAGMGLFALTLRWLDWKAAACAALAALVFNLFLMPRIGRGIYREESEKTDSGIVSYAAMVLLLILLFRDRYRPIVAAVWAMMALGDPAATIVGRLVQGPRLAWNSGKTWAGLLADWAMGSLSAVLVFWFVTGRRLEPAAVAVLIVGAAVYAFLESVRSGVDDNLVAALPTGLVLLQLGYQGSGRPWPWVGLTLAAVAGAVAFNAAIAYATSRMRLVSGSGAVAGAIAGTLVIVLGGWGAYAVLWTFFLVATVATKWGYRNKTASGVAQADRGRRGVSHVVANVGVPVALLFLGVPAVAFVAALAAALADTLGTEIGGLYGRRPFSPLKLSRLSVGAAGAVSGPGVAAGLLGAALVGSVAFLAHEISALGIAVVAAAGLAGSLAESVAHDLGRDRAFSLDHDFANALNTFVAAVVAIEIALSIETKALFLPVAGS